MCTMYYPASVDSDTQESTCGRNKKKDFCTHESLTAQLANSLTRLSSDFVLFLTWLRPSFVARFQAV